MLEEGRQGGRAAGQRVSSAVAATPTPPAGSAALPAPGAPGCEDFVPPSIIDKHFKGATISPEPGGNPKMVTCQLGDGKFVMGNCLNAGVDQGIKSIDDNAAKVGYQRIAGGPGRAAWTLAGTVVFFPTKSDCQVQVSAGDEAAGKAVAADIEAHVSK